MKKNILLAVLMLFSLAFLILQWWTWSYLDTGRHPVLNAKSIEYISGIFSTLSIGDFFFDPDVSVLHSTRFIQSLINYCHPLFVYSIFFLISFFCSQALLRKYFSQKNSFWGALLYTFNPISLYFLNEIGFVFSYFSLPLIILSFIDYFRTNKFIYILLSLLWFSFLISYTRLIWIYWIFFIFLLCLHWKTIKNIFLNQQKKVWIFFLTHIFFFLPFIFSFFSPYFTWEKEYFNWLGNYVTASINAWEKNFHHKQLDRFAKSFIPKEISYNFWANHQHSVLFAGFSLLFVLVGIGLSWFFVFFGKIDQKKRNFAWWLLLFLLILILIRSSARFLSQDIFISFTYRYFPFLAGNLLWLYTLYIPILAFLFVFVLENIPHYFNKKYATIGNGFVLISWWIYILLSIFPLINYSNNPKLQTVSLDDIPSSYQSSLYEDAIWENATLFYPHTENYFSWAPYPLRAEHSASYQQIMSNNPRLVNSKQSTLSNTISTFSWFNIQNTALLGLKDIFVFKDVQNTTTWTFDFFEIKDYELLSKQYYQSFSSNPYLYIKQDDSHLVQFGITGDNQYEYFLYSPRSIVRKKIHNFFSWSIAIDTKPVIIDDDSFHKPDIIESLVIPEENRHINISYKRSILQPTTIYISLTNIDTSKPFLVQLNETFGINWKMKWISKNDFEEKVCTDTYRTYSTTENTSCGYDADMINIANTKYLSYPSVKESNHFEGNFVGNAWLVEPDDIPTHMRKNNTLYAVLIYEKEIWYDRSLIVMFGTFGIVLLLALYQTFVSYRHNHTHS